VKAGSGFSLVEVMVSALLVALAVGSALTLVAQGRRAHRTAEARARLEESARAALDLLSYEVRLAGYQGLLPPGSPVDGSTAPGRSSPPGLDVAGGCVESLALDFAAPVTGADGAYAAALEMPLGCPPSPSGRTVPGSDTLVLRRAAVSPSGPAPGRLQLETTRRGGRLLTDGTHVLGPGAEFHDVEASAFYVSQDSTGSPGHPSLRRKRLVGGTSPAFQDEELVPGIGDLQVEASLAPGEEPGLPPGAYVPIGEVPAGARIATLRLWVLVQGDLADGASEWRPALAYANRTWPARSSRQARIVASRVIEPRNAGARR